MISIVRLHIFEILRFFYIVLLRALQYASIHVLISTRHAWNILWIVILHCPIRMRIALITVISAAVIRDCIEIRICTDYTTVKLISSIMMMVVKIFIFIFDNNLLENLMRVIRVLLLVMWLLGYSLFCYRNRGLSYLSELSLHLGISHSDSI